MKPLILAAMLGATLSAGACVAPVGPVEVTRFHVPATERLGRGTIAVRPAPGEDGSSIEFRSFAAAVSRELVRLGYVEVGPDSEAGQIAYVDVDRGVFRPGSRRGPVSVGVGGSTGSYGSGVGVGIGLDLSGPPPEQVETQLSVMIRDAQTGQSLWEGRSSFAVKSSSPLAGTQLGAPKMAEALFRGFPGESGETILVR
ncbi:hypothetical protein GCM10011371_32000 [Novosphingobium marinum]|uniref:DUF4136 domain-containing protein n=1 Tax=Novosphingobium marinum TaxID=1514948 RepID=A0A7Y9XYR1_9SPHN|nr:DUF4136 domain-containing protein [Novosphingobium marinum]NYH96940.1 hypothetical protein [Novosphingobium marinum]GGC42193.1 hypothetical protein GCM10011371_32000 [Novosphingobium marinum]